MLSIFDFQRTGDINILAITVRLVVALICGGIIGIERERKRRPAGFRTHILICIGAAMTTLTSQYIAFELNGVTDLARLGAQVIAGVGFIGAGTIIVTKRKNVKGLTTAAGLWASAIVGLCAGAGFIEGALLTTVIIIVAELLLARFEYFMVSNSRTVTIFVEYSDTSKLTAIVETVKENSSYIRDIEITKSNSESNTSCAIFSIQMPRRKSHDKMINIISNLDGVVSVEEL
ncbi:MAG: MgtC/SapB family protein [Clostridia bacterium]|nr:MgtC/SapB family protein [Clostridia bacterium]